MGHEKFIGTCNLSVHRVSVYQGLTVYTFNVVVIGKKDDAKEKIDRLCINYASLNKLIIPDRYSFSNINKILLSF